MARDRRIDTDDLATRPGTYFNPTTEVLIVVDDGAAIDADIFEGADEAEEWVLIADAAPVDETVRDELIERFSARHGSGPTGAVVAEEDDEEEIDDLDELGDIEHEEGADDDDPYGASPFDDADDGYDEEDDDDY